MAGLLDDNTDPLKAEIARLEQQIQMLQTQQPGGGGGVYGLLGYDAKGGGQSAQNFQPTISPDEIQKVYGLLAAGADDPTSVGMNYIKAMQQTDTLKASNRDAAYRITDAMRPRPVGSGYINDSGNRVVPIWDPNINDGRGGFRQENLGRAMPDTIEIGGVRYQRNPYQSNPTAADYWVPAVDPNTAGSNAGILKEEQTLGEQTGMDRAAAEQLGGMLEMQNMEIQRIINDPDFDQAVGLLDQYTGKIGAQFGSKQGVLMKDAEKISNALTTSKVSDWKGAISDKELDFFKAGVPQVGDGPDVWRSWYINQYIPLMEFVQMRARGEIDQANSNLADFIQGAQQRYAAKQNGAIDITQDPLIQKYLQPQQGQQ